MSALSPRHKHLQSSGVQNARDGDGTARRSRTVPVAYDHMMPYATTSSAVAFAELLAGAVVTDCICCACSWDVALVAPPV